ncbi:MAG: S9 family peptidase, partial [Acidimicrobiia bacterium]|nr:S9 family peptidase [Acidimicrobiia bacterium]
AEPMHSLSFSPDGNWLAFAMRDRSSDYDVDDPARREPRKIENLNFMLNGEGFISDRPSNIWVAALDGSGEVRNLTPGRHECSSPAWLADSSGIAFAYNPLLARDTSQICTVSLGDIGEDSSALSMTALTNLDMPCYAPVISPSGDTVALLGDDDHETMFQNVHVGVVDAGSDAADPAWVSKAVDRNWAPTMVAQSPTWTEDGLFAAMEDRGNVHLYQIDPTGGEPSIVLGGDRSILGWSNGQVGGKPAIAFAATDRTTPAEIHLAIGGEERRLTTVGDSFVAKSKPIDGEHFLAPSGEGADAVEVDSWIYRPKDFDPGKTYPLLLNIHGGPFTQYGNFYFDEFQMQVDAGYVVLCCNPRGGSGRHSAWGDAVRGPKHKKPGSGWGSLDYQDVMACLDEALRRYDFIDADRLGVMGGSYGGYMTSWIIGHTDRFAAACSERSANNLLSLEFGSDVAGFFSCELGPRHFDDPEEYLRMSPVTYVRDMNTPLLIIHSEEDLRCPTEQATQLFVSMKILEKDVEYWLFPGESHELTRSGSPVHRQRRAEIILEYFDRRLNV